MKPSTRRLRVLIAKPGLDGHDRGAKVIANALRDAGLEVAYTGLHQTPEMIVEVAVQEDVVRLSPDGALTQRMRLEREGVRFGPGGRVDMARHAWAPRGGRPCPRIQPRG